MSVEDGRHRICPDCKGSGTETVYVDDPDCGNCQYGDCDYGHASEIMCHKCGGTGRIECEIEDRFEGHGDLDLTEVERALLRSTGFSPWGKGGWIRDDENGGTCYDDKWAMREAMSRS